ncbi:MAG: DUF736 domain-containing protein [Bradyrhizobium sp.]|nr:DUF736 domain-containing protein [Bradyrhizobium sp.]
MGSSKKVGNDFQGEIVALNAHAKSVCIVPETSRSNDDTPSHRVYVDRVEIGQPGPSSPTRAATLSLKLDDPSFDALIYANLFDAEDDSYTPIWSRNRKQNGD